MPVELLDNDVCVALLSPGAVADTACAQERPDIGAQLVVGTLASLRTWRSLSLCRVRYIRLPLSGGLRIPGNFALAPPPGVAACVPSTADLPHHPKA